MTHRQDKQQWLLDLLYNTLKAAFAVTWVVVMLAIALRIYAYLGGSAADLLAHVFSLLGGLG